MDWITGIQNAIDYLEEHLTEEIDYTAVAREAACSVFSFQRIFHILCGYSLGEYIRNRRLTLAGAELRAADRKVIDVALKYGYESPESFTRAFFKFHGITPSEARRETSELRSFSRLSVKITLQGGSWMNYRIVKKEAFSVLEKVSTHSTEDSENKTSIPDFWTRSHRDGTVQTLLKLASDKEYLFGVCYGNLSPDGKTFEYSIAVPCDANTAIPAGFRKQVIPANTWAIFDCTGAMPDAIQNLFHRIFTEFFPTSAYRPTYELDLEAYTAGDMSSPDYRSQIWIAVTEK